MDLGGKTVEVKCLAHDIRSAVHMINKTFPVDVYLGHLAEVVFIKLFHCEVSLYTPFPCCTLCIRFEFFFSL